MRKEIPLKYFAHSITPSTVAMARMDGLAKHTFDAELPLVELKLDFENGIFLLEGDWQFMMASNRHVEQSWYGCHSDRIKIETSISPSMVIDLGDKKNDGAGFALEGTLQDGNNLSSCFGLLLIENTVYFSSRINNEWNLTFYLYDATNSDCEIRMKLPLFSAAAI